MQLWWWWVRIATIWWVSTELRQELGWEGGPGSPSRLPPPVPLLHTCNRVHWVVNQENYSTNMHDNVGKYIWQLAQIHLTIKKKYKGIYQCHCSYTVHFIKFHCSGCSTTTVGLNEFFCIACLNFREIDRKWLYNINTVERFGRPLYSKAGWFLICWKSTIWIYWMPCIFSLPQTFMFCCLWVKYTLRILAKVAGAAQNCNTVATFENDNQLFPFPNIFPFKSGKIPRGFDRQILIIINWTKKWLFSAI